MKSSRLLLCLLVGLIAIWQCNALPDFYLFNNDLAPGFSLVTDQPCRIACLVANYKGLNGGQAIAAFTTDYALEHDNCYIKIDSGVFNIDGYTEIEFFARAETSANQGFAGIFLKDKDDDLDGPHAVIPKTFKRFRFPIRNTYDDVNLYKILSPFYLELFLVKGDTIYVDNIVLRSRPYFDIFTDATGDGRESLISWGGNCKVEYDSDAYEGDHVLSVPSNTWGCGFFYFAPPLDLSYYNRIQFQLKSKVDVIIEFEDEYEKKKGIYVKKTGGDWDEVTINLSQFNIDFSKTRGAFLITKVDDPSKEVQVDQIRYLPPPL